MNAVITPYLVVIVAIVCAYLLAIVGPMIDASVQALALRANKALDKAVYNRAIKLAGQINGKDAGSVALCAVGPQHLIYGEIADDLASIRSTMGFDANEHCFVDWDGAIDNRGNLVWGDNE